MRSKDLSILLAETKEYISAGQLTRFIPLAYMIKALERVGGLHSGLSSWYSHLDQNDGLILWFEFIAVIKVLPDYMAAVAPILEKWQRTLAADQYTFLGGAHADIPFENLLYLDGKIEDECEILSSLEQNARQGKNIFLNPNTSPAESYSADAQQILRLNSPCATFIKAHEAEQKRLEAVKLPSGFYDALASYLQSLSEIGARASVWSFSLSSQIDACQQAKVRFFSQVEQCCTDEQNKALTLKQLRYGYHGASEGHTLRYITVARGEGIYDCVITQQIFLWFMLKQQRPDVPVSPQLLRHSQAAPFDFDFNRQVQQFADTGSLPTQVVGLLSAGVDEVLSQGLFAGSVVAQMHTAPLVADQIAEEAAMQVSPPRQQRRVRADRRSILEDRLVALNAVLSDSPTDSIALTNRGNVYRRLGLFDNALDDLNASIEANPGYVVAFAERGDVYLRQGLFDRAMQDFVTALEWGYDDPLVMSGLTELVSLYDSTAPGLRFASILL